MATNFLLKLEGIEGESQVEGMSGHIEVLSLRFGGTQTGSFGAGSGGGAGKFTANDLEITALTGKHTPKVLEACATGKHIKTATLICRKAGGGTAVEFLKVTMSDVIVSQNLTEFVPSADGKNELPVDQIKLNYGKITVAHKEQKPDGSAGPATEGGFDTAKLKGGK